MVGRVERVGILMKIALEMCDSVCHELPDVRVVRRKRQMRRAGVHHRASPHIGRNRCERLHAACHLLRESPGGLYFVSIERLPVFAKKVYFDCAGSVSVKVEVGALAGVESSLERICDNHIFEYIAHEGMRGHVLGRADAEQIGDKARVGEVYLRGFGDAFAEIVVERT